MKDEQGKSGADSVQDDSGTQSATPPKTCSVQQVGLEWVLALSADVVTDASEGVATKQPINEVRGETVMVGSGCARSVCPPSFAGRPAKTVGKFAFATADGTTMKHHLLSRYRLRR